MVKRREGGCRQKPVDIHKRHVAAHILLETREFFEEPGLRGLIIFDRIRIRLLNLCPRIPDIPFVIAEVDVEDRLGGIDRFRIVDLEAPGETVHEFGECDPIRTQCFGHLAGVIEVRHRKIAGGRTVKDIQRLEMRLDGGEHFIRRDEVNIVLHLPTRRTGCNPVPDGPNRLFGECGLPERHPFRGVFFTEPCI